MSPVSPYLLLPIIVIALLTMAGMSRLLDIRPATGRYSTIDGLRGYLAFFVFLHHSCIWYFYTHGYGWGRPPSWLFDQFGPTSVCVFFIITAFLFFDKLLQARGTNIDWLKLYVGRFLRIVPLYLFVILLLFLIVGILTGFRLQTPAGDLLWGMLKWLAFIQTNLNGVIPTSRIVAGVVWSLAFEWLFYCTLPFLGLPLRIRTSLLVLIPALTGMLICILMIDEFYPSGGVRRAWPFLGGIIAACLNRVKWVRKIAPHSIVSVIIVIALVLIVELFPTVYELLPLSIMTLAFTAISAGNNLFGILTQPLSLVFGQISYSIYLLHGMVLYITFTWILGYNDAGRLSPIGHWGVIALCGVGVVMVSSVTYRLIERPAMAAVPGSTEMLRKKIFPSGQFAKPLG